LSLSRTVLWCRYIFCSKNKNNKLFYASRSSKEKYILNRTQSKIVWSHSILYSDYCKWLSINYSILRTGRKSKFAVFWVRAVIQLEQCCFLILLNGFVYLIYWIPKFWTCRLFNTIYPVTRWYILYQSIKTILCDIKMLHALCFVCIWFVCVRLSVYFFFSASCFPKTWTWTHT